MKMRLLLILLSALMVSGCSTYLRQCKDSPAKDLHFYTDVKGPSKESGDCGGYAFWLTLKDGRFKSGEVAEFEGGCAIHKKTMSEVQHDPKTGNLSFYAPSASGQLVRFEGTAAQEKLTGFVSHVDTVTRKSVSPNFPKTPRVFGQIDPDEFKSLLPQGK